MAPRVGVLALQGAFARHVAALGRCGADAFEVRRPEQLSDVDGLVLPGGESTTMIKLLIASDLVEPLAKRLADGLPVFGTCAGMILLAASVSDGQPDQLCFGAIDLDVRRNGYGRQINSFEADIDLAGIGRADIGRADIDRADIDRAGLDRAGLDGGPMTAVFIRAPVVERAGEGVEVLATVDGVPVLCRQGPVLVSSFHPELTGDDRLHQLFVRSLDR